MLKRRGADYLLSRHALDITGAGISVYPRFEARQARPRRAARPTGVKLPSGLPALDGLFGGGLPEHSTTVLEGPPGISKTTVGLQFLGPCSAAEPGLLFTTMDSLEALIAKAQALDLPVAGLIDAGHVEVAWQSSTDGLLNAALHDLMQAVRRTGAWRLCIDSMTGLLQLAPDRSRLPAVFAALVHELRTLGVTSLFTSEIDDSDRYGVLPTSGAMHAHLSGVADNVVRRTARRRSSLVRLISVFKARDAQIDPRVRSYQIGRGVSPSTTRRMARRRRDPAVRPARRARRLDGVRTVLVVDDEFGVADVLEAILTDEGFSVTTAANGRQALSRIAERRPDLMLLDYMMPVLGGAGVLRALSADRSADSLPVVVMSALPEEAVAAVTRRYKAFLRKPFRIRSIMAAIEQAMSAGGGPCGAPDGAR